MNYHPDVLAAHAEFGGDLQAMQALYEHPDHLARIAALEAENARLTKERDEWEKSATTLARDFIAHVYARTEASAAVKVGPLAHVIAEMLERAGEPRPNGDILHDILAQAIPAALSPSAQQDAEAVAWLYDWADDDGVTHTEASVQSVRTVNFKPVFNVRPLYTHPPAPAVTEALREALEASVIALDDWLNIHVPDECNPERVAEARRRINAGGTLWYIAITQERNRAALQAIEVEK